MRKIKHFEIRACINANHTNNKNWCYVWGIIFQLPQHFKSCISIAFIFSEFICLFDGSLSSNLQIFVATPFAITDGRMLTPTFIPKFSNGHNFVSENANWIFYPWFPKDFSLISFYQIHFFVLLQFVWKYRYER